MKKRFMAVLICFMLIISTFCFSACSTINATTTINQDGTIDEYVSVKIDDESLINQGYTTNQILSLKNDIQSKANITTQNIIDNFNLRVQNDILSATTLVQTAMLTNYLNGISAIQNTTSSDGVYVFGIRFKNANIYRYYYNIGTQQTIVYQSEKHFLYTKYYYYGLTLYADYQSVYNQFVSVFQQDYPGIVENNKATLTFSYETDARREHSDANYIYSKNGKYYHVWVVDQNEIEKPIMIYYNIANSGNCILLCLCVTMGVCAVLWLVAFIISKNKHKKAIKQNIK